MADLTLAEYEEFLAQEIIPDEGKFAAITAGQGNIVVNSRESLVESFSESYPHHTELIKTIFCFSLHVIFYFLLCWEEDTGG